MPRTIVLQQFLDTTFPEQAANIKAGKCATCGKPLDLSNEFKDELSKKEYSISHMCQTCQDSVFG